MVIMILFVVSMFLWFLTLLPPGERWGIATPWLGFIAVLLIGLYVFVPGLRS